MNLEETQKIELEPPLHPHCVLHTRRIDNIEARLEVVERRINGIEDLRTLVQLLGDRMKLVLWMTGVATTGILLGTVEMVFNIIGKLQ